MDYEWDLSKAAANRQKHGVSFDEAASVFLDSLAISGPDPDSSIGEGRYITFGHSSLGLLVAWSRSFIRIELVKFESSVQGARRALKGNYMKKANPQPLLEEMRKEYKRPDFSKLERGKFYKQAVAGTHVVLLKPSVAKAFPTSEAVNEALSGLLTLAQRTTGLTRRSSGRTKTARRST